MTWKQLAAKAKRMGMSIDRLPSCHEAVIVDSDGDGAFEASCVGFGKVKRSRVLRAAVQSALIEMETIKTESP